MRIGLIQMVCEKGAVERNLDQIAGHLEAAAEHEADIIGFPEMSLTGYADPTRNPAAMLDLDGPEVARFLKATEPYQATVLAGLIERNPAGKPFITQIAARRGALLGAYRKITIKDEETAWFSPGDDVPVFQANGLTFGLAICADIHNEALFARSACAGARIVFELAAPGLYGEQATRDWAKSYAWWDTECQTYLSRYARTHGLWIAVATQAGRTIDEDFPGGGYVFSPSGERLFGTPDWAPGAAYLDLDLETGRVTQL